MGNGYRTTSLVSTFNDSRIANKLIMTVQQNDARAVRKMIKKYGMDVNGELRFEEGVEKMTALHYAAKKGLNQVLSEMLTVGCDVNRVTPFDAFTALHLACSYPDKEISRCMVGELLAHGGDVTREDYCGRTPLIIAAELGHAEVVGMLCTHGSDVNHRISEEEYPSGVAQALKFVTWPQKDKDEICDPFLGNSALMQACREHHVDVVTELLKNKCDLNKGNTMGNTPLHISCLSYCRTAFETCHSRFPLAGHPEIARLLLAQSQCDFTLRNIYRETALQRAIRGIKDISHWDYPAEEKISTTTGFLEIIEMLVRAGFSATAVASNGESPLTALLKAGEAIVDYDSQTLRKLFCNCLMLLLLAGSHVGETDYQLMKVLHTVLTPRGIQEYATSKCDRPSSLKRLSKFTIRNLTCKPLAKHVPRTDLPQFLQKYLLLEVTD